jgi:carotenoid 1,2-hydratase
MNRRPPPGLAAQQNEPADAGNHAGWGAGGRRTFGPIVAAEMPRPEQTAATERAGIGPVVPVARRESDRTVTAKLPDFARAMPVEGPDPSRTRSVDGPGFGPTELAEAPGFDQTVPAGGYAWWYLDALSDDGAHGLTVIAFIGSVFSPYYAWARRRRGGEPMRHCALNVALYGRSGKRWAMTERDAAAVRRDKDLLAIGRSDLTWDGSGLTIRIDEVSVPLPRRIRGRVRLYTAAVETRVLALDAAGRHRWRPIAPCARVEVCLTSPALSWSGPAYFDSNTGDRALERDFARWDWSRAAMPDGTIVLYDVTQRGSTQSHPLAMRYHESGGFEDCEPPPSGLLPATRWGVERRIGSAPGHRPSLIATLEDTPFYARSVVSTYLFGAPVTAMHESLSLDRFRAPWVQAMLPFRMPRAIWWRPRPARAA